MTGEEGREGGRAGGRDLSECFHLISLCLGNALDFKRLVLDPGSLPQTSWFRAHASRLGIWGSWLGD